jgi:hypothetical protein
MFVMQWRLSHLGKLSKYLKLTYFKCSFIREQESQIFVATEYSGFHEICSRKWEKCAKGGKWNAVHCADNLYGRLGRQNKSIWVHHLASSSYKRHQTAANGVQTQKWFWTHNPSTSTSRNHLKETILRFAIHTFSRVVVLSPLDYISVCRKLHNYESHNLYSSPNVIRMIKSSTTTWSEKITSMSELRNAYKIVVRKSEEKRPLGGHRYRRRNFRETRLEGMDWVHLA